ncbi:MAG: hypothetical protein GEU88_16220 [Solirubrobacterales bacterium]|nr:hypothetical protein [Solirubrobacterales bacterium]
MTADPPRGTRLPGPEPPQPPPEVEQAALLGHIDDAVSLYVKFTEVDPETARQVVERLADG